MQVLVIAVQNVVSFRDLGVATSGSMLFRLIGGSVGTAVLGAVLASRMRVDLARFLPVGAAPGGATTIDLGTLARLPAAARAATHRRSPHRSTSCSWSPRPWAS
jgi:hypothetical protein